MAGMRDLMSGTADAAEETAARWANSLRADAATPGIERPYTAADNALFPNSPEAAAEAAHGARFNPAPAASQFTSPGYQDHFGSQAAANEGAAAGEAGAANASRFSALRNFVGTGSPGVGSAIKNVAGGLVEPVKGLAKGNVLLGAAMGTAEGAGTDTSDYERRFGLAPNTDSGAAGVARDLGVRALGVASDIGNRVAFGLPKQYLYRDGPNGDAPTAPATPGAAAPVSTPTSLPAAANPNALTDVQRGGNPAPAEQGTAVANAPGVRQLSRNSFTNVPGDNTGQTGYGVSSIGGGAEALGREQRAAAIYKQMAAEQANADPQPGVLSAGSGMRVIGNDYGFFKPPGAGGDLSDLAHSGISPRTAATFLNARHANEVALRGQDIGRLNNQDTNLTGLRKEAMANDTSRANNQDTTGAAIYGHELSRAGTRAQLEYERQKTDRQYQFDREKHGDEQAQRMYNQREQSVKDVHSEIGNMLPPVDDGSGKKVPDTATAARYAQGLVTAVGERQAQLAQRARAGDKNAAADLEELNTKGVGGLSTADKQRFVAGMRATDLANQYHSADINPFGGTGVATTAPVKSMKRVSSLTGDYYQTNTGAKIPARAVEKENADFFGGKHRVDLNVLTQ